MQSAADEKAKTMILQFKLNDNQITHQKAANAKELQAALISASLKIVSGALQIFSGGFNAKSAFKSTRESKNALAAAKDLSVNNLKNVYAAENLNSVKSALKSQKTKIKDLKFDNSLDQTNHAIKQKNLTEIKKIENKIDGIKNPGNNLPSYDQAKRSSRIAKAEADNVSGTINTLNTSAKTRTDFTAAWTGTTNALGNLGSVIGDGVAAGEKSKAGLEEIEAEVCRQNSAMASSIHQGNLDTYQQIRSAIKEMLQVLGAIHQITASSVSRQLQA